MTSRKIPTYHVRRYQKKRSANHGPLRIAFYIALVLIVLTIIAAIYRFLPDLIKPLTQGTAVSSDSQITPTPAVTPTPTPVPASVNQQLLPTIDLILQQAGTPAADCSPAERGLVSTVFDTQGSNLASFTRQDAVSMLNPVNYNSIPGVLTFRGNNFRSAPAFGLVSLTEKKLQQNWTNPVGSMSSSSWSFSWTGVGWTGQPLLVQWDADVREMMNLYPDKKSKANLIEVISATMDGKIYFFDLEDGKPTRDPIVVGATIKGTPCVDPRGYPVLYVGQGDKNGKDSKIGFRIYNLIDESLLLYKDCSDPNAYRQEWAACDSSPIFDAKADTLIYPNENGMIYTAKMNTQFDRANGTLSINPVFTAYRYKMTGLKIQGIESSMAIYNGYGLFSDNSGILNCVDLNSLQPVWSRQLEDDSDVTPVLNQEGTTVALYTGTEVDWQQNIIGNYLGNSHVYKLDAMTGAVIWKASYPCWTKNAANVGDDINGGAMGTPVIGKKNISDLVIFSFCMTNGIYSGNSIVAYSQKDGSVVWEYKMPDYSWSSPVDVYDESGNGYILIPDSIGQVYLLDGATGEKLDVIQLTKADGTTTAGNIEASCAVFGNRLVIGTRGNVIVGVELK